MDLRYTLRSLRKNLGFTLLAVFVMALGIGANTAVFSVVNAVLLRPLDFPHPERIVQLSSLWRKSGSHGQVSGPDFHDWHDQATSFSAMTTYQNWDTAVSAGNSAEYAHVALIGLEFQGVFERAPVVGRAFTDEDRKAGGGGGAVVVSYAFWQKHFGGDVHALGSTVRLFGKALPVVGVMPVGFHFPEETDVWLPENTIFPESTERSAHNYRVAGRLKPDVTLEQAQAQMTGIGARLEQQYPASNKGKNVAVTRMRDEMVSNVRLTLYLLLGAVALVLLIACANVANLLLAKATARAREMAIRAAIGASRARIVRQLVTESVVLGLAGGGAGLVLAAWGSKALVALAPADIPRLAESGIDGGVLAFTFGLCVLASVLFGLAPAMQSARVDLNRALKQGATRGAVGGASTSLRGALVVAEIALSVVLLAGAGLLMKSFVALHNVNLGFRTEHVVIAETSVPSNNLETARRATRLYKGLLSDAVAIPGVQAASATRTLPGQVGSDGGYWLDHLPGPEGMSVSAPQAVFSVVSPGTFRTLGMPLKAGRDFSDGDVYDAPFTAIINESLARKSFPGQDPIGRAIFCGLDSMKPMRIVGIVADARQFGPAKPPAPEIFMPYEQHPQTATELNLLVRTANDSGTVAETLRRTIRARSAEIPVKFTTLDATVAEGVAAPRFRTLLLGIFAAVAVLLAMAGVYGVMAYVVGQRSSEIGLRMALGATSGDVLGLVIRQTMKLAVTGLALGLVGAAAASRVLTSVLFEVKPGDPMTYAGVAAVLMLVSIAAGYVPARRAAKVDPLVALRQE